MNCPSCGLELTATQMVCPRCGDAPGFDAGRPAADTQSAVSPWARPDSDWEWGAAPGAGTDGPAAEPMPPDAGEPTIPVPAAAEPTLAFGSPQQYLANAAHAPGQYFASQPGTSQASWSPPADPAAAPAQKRRRLLPVLLLVLGLVIAGGGVAAAAFRFGWLGAAGPRPADVMPAATLAYVQLDLDPSLAQKAQAWQFLRDLPEVRAAVASGQPDPKRLLWDASRKAWDLGGGDFDTEVKPWLGNRIGFGVVGHDDRQTWVTAIQVTDEAKALATLREWISASHQDYDVTARDGFALVTMTPDTSFVLAELDRGTLAADERFRSDLDALGDTGVLAGWVDLAGLNSRLRPSASDQDAVKGRAAFALRFSANTLSFDGRLFGLDESLNTGITGAGELGRLPATTGAAVGVSGGAKSLELTWPRLGGDVESWLQDHGLEKADVAALLGRHFAVSVSASALATSFTVEPAIGLRIVSDDVERARTALYTLVGRLNGATAAKLVDRIDGDVLTVATSSSYLAELTAGSAELGTSEAFTGALPEHAKATSGFYVDISATDGRDEFGEYSDFVSALRSVGGEYVEESPGTGSWSVRVVRS